jgi:hypothetical protein
MISDCLSATILIAAVDQLHRHVVGAADAEHDARGGERALLAVRPVAWYVTELSVERLTIW